MKHRRQQGGGLAFASILTTAGLAAGTAALHLLAILAGTPNPAAPAPTLLVLGAAQYNGHPSPLFRARLDEAARLYRDGGVTRIVVSGGIGDGDHQAEGSVGRRYLLEHGVPARVVRAETRSRDTVQNLRYSRALLPAGRVRIVTDDAHAPRAVALARALGLDADAAATRLDRGKPAFWRYAAREAVLTVAYAVSGPDSAR